MPQNTSHAVMAQRVESKDGLDDFPTPPWATRAFLEHILGGTRDLGSLSAWEPACGRGHMAQVLSEYFRSTRSSDIHDYGFGEIFDFASGIAPVRAVDWIITNPPFRLAEDFFRRAQSLATKGVALLTRTVFIESVGRYERIFEPSPPTIVAQYVERVPMVKGRLDKRASTATGYAWLVWRKEAPPRETQLHWIPPSRKKYERASDYDPAFCVNMPQRGENGTVEATGTRQNDLFMIS